MQVLQDFATRISILGNMGSWLQQVKNTGWAKDFGLKSPGVGHIQLLE